MDIKRELGSVQKLLEGGLGGGDVERNNLLTIREKLWDVQLALEDRAAERDAKLRQLRELKVANEACLLAQRYIQTDIDAIKNNALTGINDLELLDIDTFFEQHPESVEYKEDANALMMERLKDEQERRAKLFSRRMELRRQIQTLTPRVTKLRDGGQPRYARSYTSLMRDLEFMQKHLDPRQVEKSDERREGGSGKFRRGRNGGERPENGERSE